MTDTISPKSSGSEVCACVSDNSDKVTDKTTHDVSATSDITTSDHTTGYVVKSFVGEPRIQFLEKHRVKISQIVNTMFYPELVASTTESVAPFDLDQLDRMFQDTVFACLIIHETEEEVIGMCSCAKAVFYTPESSSDLLSQAMKNLNMSQSPLLSSVIESKPRDISVYDSLRYIETPDPKILFSKSENGVTLKPIEPEEAVGTVHIYDKVSQEPFNMKPVPINIDIQTLCKDKKYKDVGRFMIKKIGDHYRALGINTVSLSAESTNHRASLRKAQIQMLTDTSVPVDILFTETENALTMYQCDQISLCGYYEKLGFKLMPHTYDITRIITTANGLSMVIFYKTYQLDLTQNTRVPTHLC